jgi:LysM repeat protein/ABC-type branched-subunit amino acid transport system substrate-binding protein
MGVILKIGKLQVINRKQQISGSIRLINKFKVIITAKDFHMTWIKGFITLIFLTGISFVSVAQEIVKSSKTEVFNGKEYYLHTVKAGQTLYAIARAYQVAEDEILQVNPDARKTLKIDQILRIPVRNDNNADVYIMHTVEKGETLSSISDKYNIKLSVIYRLNPGINASVKPGQKIKLPAAEKVPETLAKGTFQTYIVQKNETLFGIARQYGTTVDELKKANPGLNETVHVGQEIRVPVKKTAESSTEVVKDTVTYDCLQTGLLSSYNVGLLMPFYLDMASMIDTGNIDKSTIKSAPFTFIGFYEGFLIALDSLERSGISLKFIVDDLAEDTSHTMEILNKPAYSDLNLLIGPFYSKNFGIAAEWAGKKHIKIVNPFSAHSEFINGNPYVFKNIASNESLALQTANYVRKTWAGCNVFLVYSAYERDTLLREEFRKALSGPTPSGTTFFEVNYSREGLAGISNNLSTEKPNIIISLISSEVAVSNYIRGMSGLSFTYPIVVFGQKSWEDLSSLELEYLLNIKLHVISNSFINYQDSTVTDFVRKYRERFQTEPDAYAFAGFDNAMYYLNALHLYGKNFDHCLDKYHPRLLHMELNFDHTDGNGYENKKICIYRYENYKLIDAFANPLISVAVNKKEK